MEGSSSKPRTELFIIIKNGEEENIDKEDFINTIPIGRECVD